MARLGLFTFLSILISVGAGCGISHSPGDLSDAGTTDPPSSDPRARCAPACRPATRVPAGFASGAEDLVCQIDCNWCVCTESGPAYCTHILCAPDAG
jgi:hypothetical protein